ncbi:integral membrane sensor signal transduction histidine kinase [Syntrophobotulus glycolicus DSM 8271]|uniref:histidine kinase n=1 Tax=Syntrophobotulus glycolicus (strain DSM 8271 / FlGlyR) TaxID=645991 RepID=F0SWT9_SYNGF|nr:ATP-binding protein [Syntrophobotulus glycolicus]ADY54629.1 integral membrane sensor signal transduction histidine kinase [Syntrophobotulus glycolicus DSM 8271]
MFKRLRLKLTLINLGVIFVFLLLFGVSTYVIVKVQMMNQTQQILQLISADLGYQVPDNQNNKYPTSNFEYFILKTDLTGNIILSLTDLPFQPDRLPQIVNTVLTGKSLRGEIKIMNQSYIYQITQNQSGQSLLISFASYDREKSMLGFLMLTLGLAGLIYLILAFFGGRFLADKAMAPIQKTWRRQQEFVADASHELRTPLTIIRTNLELVQGNPQETIENQEKWLGYIESETKRMSTLVDDLLFLARADSDALILEKTTFSLDQALRETTAPLESMANKKNIALITSYDSIPAFAGDENKIKQLTVILLDNAIKHTSPGGTVSIDLRKKASHAELIVSDTGEGIPREHLEKIFERFYRVDKSRSRAQGGTGLGLSIAEWITRSHNGTIKVSSDLSKGTIFTVDLPLNQIDKKALQ